MYIFTLIIDNVLCLFVKVSVALKTDINQFMVYPFQSVCFWQDISHVFQTHDISVNKYNLSGFPDKDTLITFCYNIYSFPSEYPK